VALQILRLLFTLHSSRDGKVIQKTQKFIMAAHSANGSGKREGWTASKSNVPYSRLVKKKGKKKKERNTTITSSYQFC